MSLRFGLVFVLFSSALAGVGQPTEKTVHVEVGESVQFANKAGVPPLGVPSGTTWEWDFGDGSPKIDQPEPSYRYKKAGEYTVTLVALTPILGRTKPQKLKVVVRAITKLPEPDPKVKLYSGQVFRIINPNPEIPGATHKWIFGDNTVSNEYSPTKYYTKAGTYTVSYQRTIGGISSPRAPVKYEILPITPKASPDAPTVKTGDKLQFKNDTEGPPEMTWEWDFGDDSPKSNEIEPYHVYEKDGEFEVTLKVKALNVDPLYSKLKVIVTPVYVTPGIISATIAPKEIGADGNYTARIIVEVKADGTYEKLTLKISGNLGTIESPSEQSKGDVKKGKHIFEITVPEPEPSATGASGDGELKVTATIYPDDPKDVNNTKGDAKSFDLVLTVIPQKPAWVTYVFILAAVLILALATYMIKMYLRPIVPGIIRISDGDEIWLNASPHGPKKGEVNFNLGAYDPEYVAYSVTVLASGSSTRPQVSVIVEGGTEESFMADGEYKEYGKPVPVDGSLNFALENGKSFTYDSQQDSLHEWDS